MGAQLFPSAGKAGVAAQNYAALEGTAPTRFLSDPFWTPTTVPMPDVPYSSLPLAGMPRYV